MPIAGCNHAAVAIRPRLRLFLGCVQVEPQCADNFGERAGRGVRADAVEHLARLRVALEMPIAGQSHNARQIMDARIAIEAPRQRPLHALELVELAIIREPLRVEAAGRRFNNDMGIEPRFEYRAKRCPIKVNKYGPDAFDVVCLAALAVGRVDGDENARALLLQIVERGGHAVKVAVHDARQRSPLRRRVVESLKREGFGFGVEPPQKTARLLVAQVAPGDVRIMQGAFGIVSPHSIARESVQAAAPPRSPPAVPARRIGLHRGIGREHQASCCFFRVVARLAALFNQRPDILNFPGRDPSR